MCDIVLKSFIEIDETEKKISKKLCYKGFFRILFNDNNNRKYKITITIFEGDLYDAAYHKWTDRLTFLTDKNNREFVFTIRTENPSEVYIDTYLYKSGVFLERTYELPKLVEMNYNMFEVYEGDDNEFMCCCCENIYYKVAFVVSLYALFIGMLLNYAKYCEHNSNQKLLNAPNTSFWV